MNPDWNACRFDPARGGGHVESYFLKLNGPDTRRALWLKATILKKKGQEPVAEAWAIAFDREGTHIAVKEEHPFSGANFSSRSFDVTVGRVHFENGRLVGSVSSHGHVIEWALDMTTRAAALVPLPTERMYSDKLPNSKLVTPHPDSKFDGYYQVDGARVDVKGWRGMQGHNWGRRHAELYGWGHCNQWDNAGQLIFEGVSARVRVGPVLLPTMTLLVVCYRGVRYYLTSPRSLLSAKGNVTPRRWEFSSRSPLAQIEGYLEADASDFVGLYYENPDGEMTHCLNSKIARGHLKFEVFGRPPVEANTRSAAFEVGTKNHGHDVAMYV